MLSEKEKSTELRWNDRDKEKRKSSEKNFSQCHLVVHKSYLDSTGIEHGLENRYEI